MKIIITWEVEDGYVGMSRPQKSVFSPLDVVDSEEEWYALSEEDKESHIDEFLQYEFENKILFCQTGREVIT